MCMSQILLQSNSTNSSKTISPNVPLFIPGQWEGNKSSSLFFPCKNKYNTKKENLRKNALININAEIPNILKREFSIILRNQYMLTKEDLY